MTTDTEARRAKIRAQVREAYQKRFGAPQPARRYPFCDWCGARHHVRDQRFCFREHTRLIEQARRDRLTEQYSRDDEMKAAQQQRENPEALERKQQRTAKLRKLRELAEHPHTPAGEAEAARAAIRRLKDAP